MSNTDVFPELPPLAIQLSPLTNVKIRNLEVTATATDSSYSLLQTKMSIEWKLQSTRDNWNLQGKLKKV